MNKLNIYFILVLYSARQILVYGVLSLYIIISLFTDLVKYGGGLGMEDQVARG